MRQLKAKREFQSLVSPSISPERERINTKAFDAHRSSVDAVTSIDQSRMHNISLSNIQTQLAMSRASSK